VEKEIGAICTVFSQLKHNSTAGMVNVGHKQKYKGNKIDRGDDSKIGVYEHKIGGYEHLRILPF
jgi:hypothetical protein